LVGQKIFGDRVVKFTLDGDAVRAEVRTGKSVWKSVNVVLPSDTKEQLSPREIVKRSSIVAMTESAEGIGVVLILKPAASEKAQT
jgi:hypothetical protein